MRVLALEVDIAAVRAAVLDVATGQPIGVTACIEYWVDHPTPDAAEVPLERVWSALSAAARSVAQAVEGIEGVGLCVATPALVILDEKDQPAARLRLPDDRRARVAARQVQEDVGAELLADTGNPPLPGLVSALSFRQLLDDDPYLIREVRRYLHLNGWLALHLTGDTAFDRANASLTGVYGTRTNQSWSPRWCEYFEVDPRWLPPILDDTATVGTIRSAVAAEIGVPPGLPLKLGTSPLCMTLRSLRLSSGDLFHDLSDPQQYVMLSNLPRADGKLVICHFGSDFVEMVFNPIGAGALGWLQSLCFRDQTEEEFRKQTIPQAIQRATRVTFDPPFLTGDNLGLMACRAAFRDLSLQADRLDLLAALLAEMRRRHDIAIQSLSKDAAVQRVLVQGTDAEFVMGLLPLPPDVTVQFTNASPLTSVASLFK
jgi:sugar (pentulose or hexulose) kinase